MSYANNVSKPPKGQMKCFQCRKSRPLREGDWQNLQNQQVFICNSCDRANTETSGETLAERLKKAPSREL